jgi:hypothetical protein
MENPILKYFESDFFMEKGNSKKDIHSFTKKLNSIFPKDYLEFMQYSDGGEGGVGANGYLILWGLSELNEINEDYSNPSLYPDFFSKFFFFARNVGPTLFCFRKTDGFIFEVPEICNSIKEIVLVGRNFTEFIKSL